MSGLLELADKFDALCAPDLGLKYQAPSQGVRRFDPHTGKPYVTASRPAELTIYGDRATFLMDVISTHGPAIASVLRAAQPIGEAQ